MTAIILAWDPDHSDGWNHAAAVERVRETGQVLTSWAVDGPVDVHAGDEAWLWLQGRRRGLLGHGLVVSGEAPGAAQPAAGERNMGSRRITVAFDALLRSGDQILPGVLADAVPEVPWEDLAQPALALDPMLESRVRAVWRELGPAQAPDPVHLVPGSYPEQAVSRVQANRFESNVEARRICVAHHGTSCAACGFSFESAYGETGTGFIQVHHLVPAGQIGNDYELDPVTDLVPLCPNCHAMAHLDVSTPRTVAELRQLIAGAGYLAGQTLSPEELEAQRDARRILEQH
jgi:5-methylcytosine-specific restriction protein A